MSDNLPSLAMKAMRLAGKYSRYAGNGVIMLDTDALLSDAGASRIIRLGTRGWLLNSSHLYSQLFTKDTNHVG